MYKKKIKRILLNQNEGSGESSEEDSSDDDSDWSDEDSDAEPFDDTICPAGCDNEIFDGTIDLRAKRCAIEDDHQDAKKAAESLRKENDALNKKSKLLEGQLKSSMADLEAFQVEKQGKLNELWVVVPLLTSQIDYAGSFERFPSKQGLVVPSETINRLSKRIEELIVEKDEEKHKYRKARQQHVHLVKGNKEMSGSVEELEEKCEQAMMLKFGRSVDIDSLGTITVSRAVEEARLTVQANELKLARKEHAMDQQLIALKEQLSNKVKNNTIRVSHMSNMKGEDYKLQQMLDDAQSQTRPDDTEERREKDREERQRMRNDVAQQQNEIQLLKVILTACSRDLLATEIDHFYINYLICRTK